MTYIYAPGSNKRNEKPMEALKTKKTTVNFPKREFKNPF